MKYRIQIRTWSRPILLLTTLLLCLSCGGRKPATPKTAVERPVPVFQQDSAYAYVQRQVDFGPRVPGTAAHRACGDYLVASLAGFGAQVIEQTAQVRAYDGSWLDMRNIIGSFQPDLSRRVLLAAHWDCRPWSDQEPLAEHQRVPVDGANDGASGVGILLEVARQIGACLSDSSHLPAIGVDIIFFDTEDYGTPVWAAEREDTWCLGSQYWARHPHRAGYRAEYGILLDMVGAKNACFMREYFSDHYAQTVVSKVWNQAEALGYGTWFVNARGGAVTDDHLYVNRLSGIPCIDIIDFDDQRGGFFAQWHTRHDNMDQIDARTLKAVGQTLLAVIYSE